MDSTDEIDENDVKEENYLTEMGEMTNYIPDPDTTCTICYAEFLDPEDLKIHLAQVHKITTSTLKKCQFCPIAYADMMEYATHIIDSHLTSLKSCSLCWRVFDDFDAHRTHRRKHSMGKTESTYSCSQCQQRYADLFSLKKHEYEHNNVREGVLMYDVLPYLSAALKVKSVSFIETLGTDVVYICVGCDLSTVDMSVYLHHLRTQNCQVYVCHTCGNVFKQKKNLIKHFNGVCNIFGVKEKKTKLCPGCNISFPVRLYSKHKTQCKPIKCYTCDINFPTMNDWLEHQSREHSSRSIEVETCQFCWKRCVGSVAMKKHIDKAHRPEFHLYKYLCIYCKSVFKHPQKLFGHFVTRHKDISPYTCKICDKTFKFRKRFTIHIKLSHDSVGFVEFDENYHVFFSDKKSENPFVPKSLYVNDIEHNLKTENDVQGTEDVALNSDFINVGLTDTEANLTEGNKTEVDVIKEPTLKRKRNPKTRKQGKKEMITIESSDDDESLYTVRKRVKLQKKKGVPMLTKGRRVQVSNRTALTCNICKKYCYTYQNYNHHVSLHSKNVVKKCIKCAKIFKSRAKLNEHIAVEHSSSKLTETLKTILEKRKTGGSITENLPTSVKFRRTLVKVMTQPTATSAKITPVDQKLSVQKFFENFVPEESKVDVNIDSTAVIKLVTGYAREPAIKMTKFKPQPISTSRRLAMPVKFVDHCPEKTKATLKLIEAPCKILDTNAYYSDQCDEDMDRHDSDIPEVAEEVMLENTEEIPKQEATDRIGHKVVIPKLPTELTDIRIAHLLPEAPFYKIVKVKDVIAQTNEQKDKPKKPCSSIQLADGTKLVTTNPLAHLLGDKQDVVLESVKNKYYKSRNQNFQGMLAKALTMLDKPSQPLKKKKEIKEEN